MRRMAKSAIQLGLLSLVCLAVPDSGATSPQIRCYLGTNQWCVTQGVQVTAMVAQDGNRQWTLRPLVDLGESPLLLRETRKCDGNVSAMPFLGMQEKAGRDAEGRETIEVSFSFGSNADGYPGCTLSFISGANGERMTPNNRRIMMHSILVGPGWEQMSSLAKHAGLNN
ncbi:hypothetical protein [Niveispirillum sp.]|uniref:hypothetical protein n=1 Tax=Niveispirillum sp. TaxID=1917217 RepID=UPI001B758AE1|nr:hypothetical protein [Niveispirillum sp.]MBP7337635.1 hypothetical protein [Niveispirillum sp.]